jgi:signal transduction histidine kinase
MAERDENELAAREPDRSWRAEVLDIWLRAGAAAFPVIAIVVIALRRPPRFDLSAVTVLVLTAVIVVLARATRWRFEVRATAALVVFAATPLLLVERSGFALGGGAILITAVVLTVLLFGRRVALALLVVIAAALIGVGAIAVNHPNAARLADSDSTVFLNWVRMALSLSVVTGVLVVAIDHVVRRMDSKRAALAQLLAKVTTQDETLQGAYDELGLLHRKLVLAREDEQRRIARELHDQLGQMLTALKLKLRLRAVVSSVAAEAETVAIVDWLLERVRNLSLDLRPPLLDEMGLVPALEVYLRDQSEISGIAMELEASGLDAEPARETQIACFRLVQEAVTNVLRHAKARKLRVRLAAAGADVEVSVRDDGCGFAPQSTLAEAAARGHIGIVGVRERVRALGGHLTIESAPGEGTTLRATLPSSPLAEFTLRRVASAR